MKTSNFSFVLFGVLVSTGMMAGPVGAQADDFTLETIVVTARRAQEVLQEVPLSITALRAEDIEAAGISKVEDIAALTPGFSFRSGFGRSFERPVIRGMSSILGAANASFFVDGVFVNGPIAGYNMDNLERIEVIRGPQSALFGRSTFAGAINFVTRRPKDILEGSVKLTAGEYGHKEATAWVSGPLIDGILRFQLDGRTYERDGQYRNLATGRKDMGGQKSNSVGATLLWTPAEWFDATLRVNYLVDKDEFSQIARLAGPGTGIALNDVLNCYQPEAGTRRRGYYCGRIPTVDFVSSNTDSYREAGLFPGQKLDALRTSLVLNGYWNDYTLTSTTTFDKTDSYQAFDQDYSILRGFGGAFETAAFDGSDFWSQELRVASPSDGRIRWQAGVYYYEANPDKTTRTGNLVASATPGLPDGPPVLTKQKVDASTENKAVFGTIEYEPIDDLIFTFEGRYAKDSIYRGGVSTYSKSSNTGFISGTYSTGCTITDTPLATAPDRQTLLCVNAYANNVSFSNFLPRFTATWIASDSMTYYLQYAKGNKSGGFNADAENARTTPEERAIFRAQLGSYDEEEAGSYEIGLKSSLFNRRLQLNAALYYIDWTKQQLTVNFPYREEGQPVGAANPVQFINSYIDNLGESRIRGFELEAMAQLNQHWSLRTTYAYQDTKIRDYFSPDQADLVFDGPYTGCVIGSQCYADYRAAGDVSGHRLPRVPKHLASASLSAEYPIGDWGVVKWRTDYSYEASRYVQIHNLAETGSANTVNMRLGVERGPWEATLWVKNLFDDRTPVEVARHVDPGTFISVPVQPPLPGTATLTNPRDFLVTLPERRMFGLTLAYRY